MKKAFTLVELLVVVLIIGILSAIAIPMYQGAVDKSHWSTMLPGAKAIKDAQEAIKLTNGLYTSNMEDLDVTMNSGSEISYSLETINHGDDSNVIRVTNSKLANVRLASYLDENP
ncbi:MAG: prepilin-type N-terminal cleavage/methylation domain-containing protein, partial [Elusimicrobiaceae bacterium]|nr:prepilin-type N-terminal cleavage/methylation domain-containing protein [Elusimicrobiaceae bacterium]